MPSVTGLELIKEALIEINAHAPGESLPSEHATFALSKLNEILDSWSARKIMAYNSDFTEYTLTPNLQPHTLGPSGALTPVVTQRPVDIPSASIVLTTSTPNVRCPLNIRDKDWWASVSVPGVASSIPSDLYYAPTFPNGSIYLWPKPDTAYKLEIETLTLLLQATLAAMINLPPSYKAALVLSLAIRLCPAFGKEPKVATVAAQMKAMEALQVLNSKSPRISTRDSGIPGGNGGGYDIWTGGMR
jgi:hypothetical protein